MTECQSSSVKTAWRVYLACNKDVKVIIEVGDANDNKELQLYCSAPQKTILGNGVGTTEYQPNKSPAVDA